MDCYKADLMDKEIRLVLKESAQGDPQKGWVPALHFAICSPSGEQFGSCILRVGHNGLTYYGGNIVYEIFPEHRGHRYAAKACMLLFEQARQYRMEYVLITCNPDNQPSRKTCEAVGGKLLEIVQLPPENDMYKRGEREKCIYRVTL